MHSIVVRVVAVPSTLNGRHLDSMRYYLSTCEALEWKGRTDKLETQLKKTSHQNLRSIAISGFCPISYSSFLPVALFASSPRLKNISLSKLANIPRSKDNKMNEVFESLVSCPYPDQLSVDLSGDNDLGPADVETLVTVWRRLGQGKKFKAVLLRDSLQTMVQEMVLQI